jgi:carotenoid cleavage dioxygenase-like enzyme
MKSAPRVTRWTVDLGRDGEWFGQDQFCDVVCEFPRVEDRCAALAHRHGYMSVFDFGGQPR